MTPESSWSQDETPYSLTTPRVELTETPDNQQGETLSSSPLPSPFPDTLYGNRRWKAALVLIFIWTGMILLHLVSWGIWLSWGLTAMIGIHLLRMCWVGWKSIPPSVSPDHPDSWPFISILVAAKNEEKVIRRLVESICHLDYPSHRYELWVIDDNSSDGTAEILQTLTAEYPQLKVFYRSANATGGKSGALNQVWPLTQGDIIGVFDADAQVAPDLLTRLLPLFLPKKVGGVQVQKVIANESFNFWTIGQSAEMALDSFLQERRITLGGTGELRGNGQFVRRSALRNCGAWNEETITDDLDLTFRLQLENWDIDFLSFPAILEEGVTTPLALWHQRNRWAEGGYQRYLDYWFFLLKNRLGTAKSWDALMFFTSQYLLPTAIIPDFSMALIRHHFPLTTPFSFVTIILSFVGMFIGLVYSQSSPPHPTPHGFSKSRLQLLWQSVHGTFYMLHWLVVMASVTLRVAFRPKRLKWVKTQHQG